MVNFFSIKTRSESEVGICDGKLSIFNVFDQNQKLSRVIGFFIESLPNHIFLCSVDKNKNISIESNPYKNTIIPMGWGIGFSKNLNSMHSILNYNWVSFPPIETLADIGNLRVNDNITNARFSGANLDWEEVKIVPFSEEIPDWIREISEFLNNAFFDKKPIDIAIEIIKSDKDFFIKKSLINAMNDFLSDEDLKKISTYLFYENDISKEFFKSFCDDFWVSNSIFPCISWVKTQFVKNETGGILFCGSEFDHLQNFFEKTEFCSIFHALSFYVRSQVKPTKKSCIVTTIRNEGPYILEWIMWHKRIGFEHIFIYMNDNDDGSTELLEKLANKKIITLIKNEMNAGVRPQAKVCVHMFSILTDILEYEWALVIDADEFVALNKYNFQKIDEYISWISKKYTDAVAINWKYMSSNDGFNFRNTLVTEKRNFIQYHIIGAANNLIKSMSRPNKIMSSTAHNAVCPSRRNISYRLSNGIQHRYAHNSAGYSDNPMWADESHHDMIFILHYHYKSSEEFLLRLYRGDVLDQHYKKTIGISMFDEHLMDTFIAQHEKHGESADDLFFVETDLIRNDIKSIINSLDLHEEIKSITDITNSRIAFMEKTIIDNYEQLGENTKKFYEIMKNNSLVKDQSV